MANHEQRPRRYVQVSLRAARRRPPGHAARAATQRPSPRVVRAAQVRVEGPEPLALLSSGTRERTTMRTPLGGRTLHSLRTTMRIGCIVGSVHLSRSQRISDILACHLCALFAFLHTQAHVTHLTSRVFGTDADSRERSHPRASATTVLRRCCVAASLAWFGGCYASTDIGPSIDIGLRTDIDSGPRTDTGIGAVSDPAVLAAAVRADAYQADLVRLATLRSPGTAGWQMAQALCSDRLVELGFDVERDAFGAASGTNVIGRIAGASTTPQTVNVSAHYDGLPGIGGAAGASNGSRGVSVSARRRRYRTQHPKAASCPRDRLKAPSSPCHGRRRVTQSSGDSSHRGGDLRPGSMQPRSPHQHP